jgi:phytanoyl-CoA hydroxylase
MNPQMITPEMKQEFDARGYLVVPGLLTPADDLAPIEREYAELLDRVAHELHAAGKISSTYEDLPFSRRIATLIAETKGALHSYLDICLPQKGLTTDTPMHTGPAIFALMTNARLLDAVEHFIGPEIYSNPTQHVRIKPPEPYLKSGDVVVSEISRTVWHQDLGTVSGEADETNLLTVWIPVTHSNRRNGCLLVAPGSHKRGLALHCHDPHANYSRQAIPERLVGADQVALEMQPSDVLLMNRLTMHASLPNQSDDIRWSLDLRYNPIGQPTGRGWFPGFVARSRTAPDSELRDADEWAALWDAARTNLISNPPDSFQRWSVDDPGCA